MKRCKKCGEAKPLDEFHLAKGMADGHRSECKECHRARMRQWYSDNRERAIAGVRQWQHDNKEHLAAYRRDYRRGREAEAREGHLKRKFGLTQADYEDLLARQGGGCRICGKRPGKISLHVDHDHETGKVRGLLCVGCNNALGQFHDDAALLHRAIRYLDDGLSPLVDELEWRGVVRDRARALLQVSG
jgi:Recombination endonuclease VII